MPRTAHLGWVAVGPTATYLLFFCACGEDPATPEFPEFASRAPLFLIASHCDPERIDISWEDGSSGELSFEVLRRDLRATSFEVMGLTPAEATSFTDTSVDSGGAYEYAVRSVGDTWRSTPSRGVECEASVQSEISPPVLVSPPDAAVGVSRDADLSWTRVASSRGSDVVFDLFVRDEFGDWTLIAAGVNAEVASAGVLREGAHYDWRVVARHPLGPGARSRVLSFATAPAMFVVEEGYFLMGEASSETCHPGNPIWLPTFSMDATEVTNQQFADFLTWAVRSGVARVTAEGAVDGSTGRVLNSWSRQAGSTHVSWVTDRQVAVADAGWENHPVTGVSWYGAQAYARALGRRLPTEAEWEKAARGASPELGDTLLVDQNHEELPEVVVGVGYPYPWGLGVDGHRANFLRSGAPIDVGRNPPTLPVGFFDGSRRDGFPTKANAGPYGSLDMAGNVSEWTADWFAPYASPHDPPKDGLLKVVRGGGWGDPGDACRTSARAGLAPGEWNASVGVRTVAAP